MTRNRVAALLALGRSALDAAGIEDAGREARLLLAHALGLDAGGLMRLAPDQVVADEPFLSLLARRCGREPMALLTGACGFWTLELAVAPCTLVPRADSETLIEAVLAARPDHDSALRVLDLGTGTGCLLLAVLSEYPHAFGVGVDRCAAAATLAAANAAACGLLERSTFLCGDWDAALDARFDLVLSNPPYIPDSELAGLMPEVRDHEPAGALAGGADGLDCYRWLMLRLSLLLRPDGMAVLELGQGQAAPVMALARAAGLEPIGLRADLGGVERALSLRPASARGTDAQKPFGSVGGRG